jgi:hypothetical protein
VVKNEVYTDLLSLLQPTKVIPLMFFHCLMATSMKMAVFWDVVQHPNDGDSKLLRNITQYLPVYTA